ncbi:ribonuclease [Rhodanobacter sp. FW510-R12]|uniref:ribonuclease domain-containing protein n=1 Tax=unclassified Rhodanobacter TaxID=2621553 RepID=UPI0007AA1B58|nr:MULTISPECIES: ribonuclease domain-containing protein [unclassified Rhodanobacter]KZC18397.1 ribonuclease [Rhodanobacter sp. FW104-R8]KZC28884.1 ribonuclease [Rhodanobacter sp. FW510-T8]KZC30736.1 ribonuclease [Rhodanobacter sp. FW510-R10]
MRPLKPLILLAIIIVTLALWNRHGSTPQPGIAPTASAPSQASATASPADALPPEAHDTLERIARGGPFERSQDGAVFGNYEGLLPKQPRGYYHEYTVATPGARNRGARRIITGGTPPVVWYYTDDHYRSFRRLEAAR